MFSLLLVLASSVSLGTIGPGQSVSITLPSGSVAAVVGKAKPFICKDGSRPELPGPMISKCRAEFMGGITIQGWAGPFWNPTPGFIEPWTGRCQDSTMWMKKFGGDGKYYSDPDFLPDGKPKRGARPCGN